MSRRAGIAGIVVIAAAVLFYLSAFTVDLMHSAIVLRFGEPRRVLMEPGLYIRWPNPIESVVLLDNRVLNFESPAEEFVLGDQKRVIISSFVRYQIVDPLTFYRVAKTTTNAESSIRSVLKSTLQQRLGDTPMTNILSPKRAQLMADVAKELTDRAAKPFGIRVIDERFKAVDLPPQNSEAVYGQMRSQRAQEAAGIRADGDRRAVEVKAEADKERVVELAEARRKAAVLRGEGEAEATRIYNEAFGMDPAFFEFYRSLQAMRDGLTGNNTTFVGAPTGDFFRYFDRETPALAPGHGAAPKPENPAPAAAPEPAPATAPE
jgi:membrane protease subunit HflC